MYPAIPVEDQKGDQWLLGPTGQHTTSDKGLVEMWWYVLECQYIPGYSVLPLPVFIEWWH